MKEDEKNPEAAESPEPPKKKRAKAVEPVAGLPRPAPERVYAKGYTVGDWRGNEHYECLDCRFETLNKTDIEEHITKHGEVK